MSPHRYSAGGAVVPEHPATGRPVQARVRVQMAFIATCAFTVFLPLVLATLIFTSVWTGWVNVMAMHTYLDGPDTLPGAAWAVPVAVQAFIIAGEATMVLNSVLRRRWIVVSGAAVTAAGYSVEVGAHVYFGDGSDAIMTMVVAAVACGGGWALVAALMDRGVQIADGEGACDGRFTPVTPPAANRNAGQPDRPRPGADQGAPSGNASVDERASAPEYEPESAPTPEPVAAPVARKAKGRRSRAELLGEVRALNPDRLTLSPNYVACRIGVSWASAKSLLDETGRLAVRNRDTRASQQAGDRRPSPTVGTWSPPRAAWSAGQRHQ